MAKRSAPAPAPNGTVTPGPGLGATKSLAQDPAPEPAVIEWDGGNGQSRFQAGTLAPEAPPPANPAAEAAGKEEPAEGEEPADPALAPVTAKDDAIAQAEPAEGEAAEKPPEAPPAPKRLSPEERRRALQALDAERGRVSLESEARAQRERADRLEAEAKKPLAERLRGLSAEERERLLETLLVGGDAPAETPQAQESPELAALKQQVADLNKKLESRETAEANQQIERALADVAETIKEVPTPLVHALPGGYDLVLRTAHQAWLAAKRSRPMREFLPGAAEVVEEHYRQQHPGLAKLVDASAGGPAPTRPKETPAAPARAPATSIGKRTAARPDAQPTDLPMDKHERDQAIKKEMGWS